MDVSRKLATCFLLYLFASCEGNTTSTEKVNQNSNEPIPLEDARVVYTLNCASCHGGDGKLGASNAADLSVSTLNAEEIEQVIRKGNDKGMMPYEEMLSTGEIKGLVQFVQNLRK